MDKEYIKELKELKNLQNEGIITEEEFNKKKEQILFENSKIQKNAETKEAAKTNSKKLNLANKFDLICGSLIILFLVISIFMLCFSKVDVSFFYIDSNRIDVIGSPFLANDIRKVFSIILVILLPLAIIVTTLSLFFKNKLFNVGKHLTILITVVFGFLSFIFNLCYAHNSSMLNLCTLFGLIFIGITTLIELIVFLKIVANFFKNYKITL